MKTEAESSTIPSYTTTVTPSWIVARVFKSITLTNVVFDKVEKLKPISEGGFVDSHSANPINYYHQFKLSDNNNINGGTGGDISLNIEVSNSGSGSGIVSYPTLYPVMDEPLVQIVRWVFVVIYAILFGLGMVNVLALFIVARFKKMRTVTNTFIFNLCLADLIYVTFLPFIICFRVQRTWIFGEVICKLFYIAESTAKLASVYFVCVLSVDRYLALCFPTWCKQHRRVSLAVILSVFGWCITAALITPIFLYSTVIPLDPNGTVKICGVRWPDGDHKTDQHGGFNESFSNDSILPTVVREFKYEQYWAIYSFVFCFALPTLVILFFYFKVLEQLLQASDRADRLKRKKEQSYRKVTRMVLVMVAFYFICWSAYWILLFVTSFAFQTSVNTPFLRILFNIIHTLPYLNCAVNPVIYGLLTQTFKKILVDMFPCCKCLVQSRAKTSPTKSATKSKIGEEVPMHSDFDHHYEHINHHDNRRRHLFGHHKLDDDDTDSIRFIRSSISNSVHMVSNLCLSLLAKQELCNGVVHGSNGKLHREHSVTTISTTENGKVAQDV